MTASAGRGADQPLAGERGDDQRGGGAALDEAGDAESGEERREALVDALAQHAPQVGAVQAQDARAHDVRAPHEQRHAGQQVEQRLHGQSARHHGSEYVLVLVKLFIASCTPSL